MSEAKVWRIQGFESTTKIYERSLPFGKLSESEIIVLLQRLASRSLDQNEVIAASLRSNDNEYVPLLEAQIDRGTPQVTITVGQSPYYIASVREQ